MQQPEASTSEENKFQWTPLNILRLLTCFVAFLFAVLGFLVQLGSVGSLNSDCDGGFETKCDDLFREHWWATFFQAAVVVLTLGSVAFNIVKEVSVALAAFLAIATIQLINSAEVFLDKREFAEGERSVNDIDAAAFGFIISAAANFLMILVIGISARPKPVMPKMRGMPFGVSQQPIVVQPAVVQMEPQGTSVQSPTQPAKVVN